MLSSFRMSGQYILSGIRITGFLMYLSGRTRIHILNKKAFALATVMIPLRIQADNGEKVDRLTASTYNLENGQVAETNFNPKEVFEEREDKNYIKKKFTMPAVKDGSIMGDLLYRHFGL